MTEKITQTKEAKNSTTKSGRRFSGVVVSDKMKNTVVVNVTRFVKHPKYGKFVKRDKNFKADDPGNTKKVGDKVIIQECRPISKNKHFKII